MQIRKIEYVDIPDKRVQRVSGLAYVSGILHRGGDEKFAKEQGPNFTLSDYSSTYFRGSDYHALKELEYLQAFVQLEKKIKKGDLFFSHSRVGASAKFTRPISSGLVNYHAYWINGGCGGHWIQLYRDRADRRGNKEDMWHFRWTGGHWRDAFKADTGVAAFNYYQQNKSLFLNKVLGTTT